VEFWMGVGDAEEAGSSARVGGGVRRPGRAGRAGQNRLRWCGDVCWHSSRPALGRAVAV
jgi:hypothetical protein